MWPAPRPLTLQSALNSIVFELTVDTLSLCTARRPGTYRLRRLVRRVYADEAVFQRYHAVEYMYEGCAKEFECVGGLQLHFHHIHLLLAELGLGVQMALLHS